MKTCPICEQKIKNFHKNSHVMPKWIFKDIYDEKHIAMQITIEQNPKKSDTKKIQGPSKGEFFCEDCEKETGEYDRYGASLFDHHSQKNFPKTIKIECKKEDGTNCYYWSGVDFLKLQKFVYSIFLKQHLYIKNKNGLGIFQNEDFVTLRSLYLHSSKILNDTAYPILIFKTISNQQQKISYHEIITCPDVEKDSLASFSCLGYFFLIPFGSIYRLSGDQNLYNIIQRAKLRDSGTFVMIETLWSPIEANQKLNKDFINSLKHANPISTN